MRSNVKSLVDDSEDEAQLRSSRGVDDIQERRINLEVLIGIECCPVVAGAWSESNGNFDPVGECEYVAGVHIQV